MIFLSLLQACTSIPSSHMLLPSRSTQKELQGLGRNTGAVADALTIKGEEHFFLISPSDAPALVGQLIDGQTGSVLPDQLVTEPFDSLALVYYAEPVNKAIDPRERLPIKKSYPKLAALGAQEQGLSCDGLAVDLARAEAVRWFARNEGAMGYTGAQQALRHATNAAEFTAATALALLLIAGGGDLFPSLTSALPPDPRHSLAAQVGEEELRWAVTAADARIVGLLNLRREKACAEQPTLTAVHSDRQNLVALDALVQDASAGRLSDEALLHEQTRLLDELGPLPLPAASNRNCGALFKCGVIRGDGRAAATGAQDEGPSATYEPVAWYADVSRIASMKTLFHGKQGMVVVTDQSMKFRETDSGQPAQHPLEIIILYTDIASIDYRGSKGWDVWVTVITRIDGHTDSLSFGGARGPARTKAFAELLNSKVDVLRRTTIPPGVAPTEKEGPH